MWISPSYRDTDFPAPMSLDDKITIFEDRTLGWKLDIADRIINGTEAAAAIPHSGYATLDIVFSYFELVGKYEAGYADLGRSEDFFKEGVYSIFPALRSDSPDLEAAGVIGDVRPVIDEVLDIMYSGVRCGIYHSGITDGRVVLTSDVRHPLAFDPQSGVLVINPHRLVPALKEHLQGYISRLREEANQDLRNNFESRFDFDTSL